MENDLIDIYFADLDSHPVPITSAQIVLSEDEVERSLRFKFEILGARFLTRRWLLRQLLSERTDQPPAKLEFEYGEFGKPSLKGNSSVHFNLSHSSRWCAIAICEASEIGVDIEEIEDISETELVSSRFFTDSEADRIRSAPDVQTGFFKCWTRKEAVIKAVGTGLSMPLDKFQVSLEESSPKLEWIGIDGEDAGDWSLHSTRPAERLITAVAVRAPGARFCDHGWLSIKEKIRS
ncbi:MAG: 4-phosphopantetheinyl transferase [Acidobacteria bacterium]|nr:MAG: 4-phosphopantetheinyl transferase [Acidobacteriota bacterium]REJ98987.1 MAG: 4-phosphopantetheinyl transferase [Acidobacteriota bacterium]REK16293.1 MAG: 4-phosphopantetheinyl transferase [Acidobacteriota bacterium]REK43974.1 MAG: 4-phosphopantetheinyl transferase [Acidobacteriota bacterium]